MEHSPLNARAVFDHAIEIESPAGRQAYVVQACGDDAGLRQKVDALLRAYGEAGSFLESPAAAAAAGADLPKGETAEVWPSGPPAHEGPGSLIGPYKLLQQIGEGGMGVVFLAEQQRPVRRQVALKVIKAGMDTRQVVARFEAERQALALMDHVNIARVLDAGATESGRPYFVMELVKGVPITDYSDHNRLTARERLQLFVRVCQAVQHAHTKGVIHRDLKPSNVLVALYDDRPVPKVIDFGVAKAVGARLTDATLFTEFGSVLGTVQYMSPEQAGLNQLDVDTRSDIYSLGVLLYELLTGTTPLEPARVKSAALLEVLRLVREEESPRPSTRLSTAGQLASISAQRDTDPAKLTKLIRGELDWIVMKALEKDRGRRYETANGFAMDVQRYLADEAVQACPPSAAYRLRKFARRNRAALASTGLALLVLVTLTGGIGLSVYDRAARRTAVEQEVKLALNEAEQWQGQGKWPEALSASRRAEGVLAGGDDDELRNRVHELRQDLEMVLRLEDVRLLSSEWKDDKFDFESADQAYSQAFAERGIDVAGLPADEAAARIRARPGVAIALVAALDDWAFCRGPKDMAGRLALTAVAQAADPDPWRRQVREAGRQKDRKTLAALAGSPELLRQPPTTLQFLARAIRDLGDAESAIEVLRRAQRQYPGDFWINLDTGRLLDGLGPPYRDEAVAFDRAALAARPQSIAALNNLGIDLDGQGKVEEAIAIYRRAIELDPQFTRARVNLGKALQKQGKVDGAIDYHRKTISLDPKSASAHIALGIALVDRKQMDEAIGEYHKATDLNPKNALAYYELGYAFAELGKLPEAIEAYHKAIDVDPKNAVAHNNLGAALVAQNMRDEGVDEFRKAIKLDPKYATPRFNLGCELSRKGLQDDAIVEFREAVRLEPGNAEVHFALAFALRLKGLLDIAVAEYREAIRLDKNHAGAHGELGTALLDQNKPDEAVAHLREAARLTPKSAAAHNMLGKALVSQNNVDDGIAAYRQSIALDPKSANAHYGLGYALMRKGGRDDEVIAAYRQAIALDPQFALPYHGLGNTLMRQGKHDEAIAPLRKATQLDPKNASAFSSLGYALCHLANDPDPKRRDPERAIELANEAVQLAPQSAAAWQCLGWVEYRAGNWQASIEALEKSCKLQQGGTGDAFQWLFLAMAHAQLGHKQQARQWYDKAIESEKVWPEQLPAFRGEVEQLLGVNEKK